MAAASLRPATRLCAAASAKSSTTATTTAYRRALFAALAALGAAELCASGIARDGYCCASSCGACGGSKCGARPGGVRFCCTPSKRHERRECRRASDVGCALPEPAVAPAPLEPACAASGGADDPERGEVAGARDLDKACRRAGCVPGPDGACKRPPGWLATKIVGVGWKKTGTTSLQAAFRSLGLEPECQCSSLRQLDAFKATQDAAFSWNVTLVAEAKARYPAAKFVLTWRDPAAWNASIAHWTTSVKPWAFERYARFMGDGVPGSAAFLAAYRRHSELVRTLFRDEPDRLLVLNVEDDGAADAMRRLCAFVEPALLRVEPACRGPFPWHRLDCARRGARSNATCDDVQGHGSSRYKDKGTD